MLHTTKFLGVALLLLLAGFSPAQAQTDIQTPVTTDDGGFDDWGLLGLLGLAGLLGRKRERTVDTRRV